MNDDLVPEERMPLCDAPTATASHRVGPFDVTQDQNALVLRFEDKGELSLRGCLLFACLGTFVLTLGILALIEAAGEPMTRPVGHGLNGPAHMLAPPENHFGVLWIVALVAIVVGIPVYVRSIYHSALVFTFRRSDDAFLRGSYRVTRLRQIEYLTIREMQDPDDRYLYVLDLFYGDGRHIELHRGYEEREVMNLANEVSAFVERRVVWREGERMTG